MLEIMVGSPECKPWRWVTRDSAPERWAAETGAVSSFWGGCLQFVGLFALSKPVSWLAAGYSKSTLSPFPAGSGLRSRGYVCRIPYYGRIFLCGAWLGRVKFPNLVLF